MIKKRKNAQTTIFIIVAIIFLSVIIGIFLLKNSDQKSIYSNDPVYQYIQSCFEQTSEQGLLLISMQGGYYSLDPNQESVGYLFFKVPYYFSLGKENIPSKRTIEKELEKYIENELNDCINTTYFEDQGYVFESQEPKAEVSLGKKVDIKIDYPTTYTRDELTTQFKNFQYEIDFNFNKIYEILKDFAKEHQKNPNYYPIGYLSLLAKKNNFKYELSYPPGDEVIYSFIFKKALNNKNLIYNFAGKYNWDDLKIQEKIIRIKPIPTMTAYESVEFSYKVELDKNPGNVKFTDFTDIFDINENTGEIKFTPDNTRTGQQSIIIKVYDNKGNDDTSIMTLNFERNFNINFTKEGDKK